MGWIPKLYLSWQRVLNNATGTSIRATLILSYYQQNGLDILEGSV